MRLEFFRHLWVVDAKIAGDGLSPNTRQVNLKCTISKFRSSGSSSHKNRSISLSVLLISTIRKAFSMSALRSILCQQKLTSVSNNWGYNLARFQDNRSTSEYVQGAWLNHHTQSLVWLFRGLFVSQHGVEGSVRLLSHCPSPQRPFPWFPCSIAVQ